MGRRELGFTIIETTIVLGISSLLMVAVLAGSMVAINQQRYSDGVSSLHSLVQSEYIATTRVVNLDRSGQDFDCNTSAVVSPVPVGTPRGASDCVVIGRFFNVVNGTSIQRGDVIGYHDDAVNLPDGDIAALQAFQLALHDASVTESEPSWGTAIVNQGGSTPSTFGVLILRSPLNGNVLTFISDGSAITSANVEGLVDATHVQERTMCLDARGLYGGPRSAVVIQAGAAGPNAVSRIEEGSGC